MRVLNSYWDEDKAATLNYLKFVLIIQAHLVKRKHPEHQYNQEIKGLLSSRKAILVSPDSPVYKQLLIMRKIARI